MFLNPSASSSGVPFGQLFFKSWVLSLEYGFFQNLRSWVSGSYCWRCLLLFIFHVLIRVFHLKSHLWTMSRVFSSRLWVLGHGSFFLGSGSWVSGAMYYKGARSQVLGLTSEIQGLGIQGSPMTWVPRFWVLSPTKSHGSRVLLLCRRSFRRYRFFFALWYQTTLLVCVWKTSLADSVS